MPDILWNDRQGKLICNLVSPKSNPSNFLTKFNSKAYRWRSNFNNAMLFGNGLNFFQVCKCIFEFFFCRRKNRTFWWGFEIILRLCRHFVWRIFFCLVWFYYTKLDFLVRIIKHEEIHGKYTDDFLALRSSGN